MHLTRRLSGASASTLGALAAALLIAACGGSHGPSGGTATNAAAAHADEIKFAQCMRTHGISDFPDPSQNGGTNITARPGKSGGGTITVNGHAIKESGVAFNSASKACQHLQPQGPPVTAAQLASVRRGALKMARCMRAHGVPNFPDPQVSTGPGGRGIAIGIHTKAGSGGPRFNPQSPAFKAAQKVCMPLMSGALPHRPGS